MDHLAVAVNWDGKEVTVTFRARQEDIERLAKSAHEAFHRAGKWTIQLKEVDGVEVPIDLHYHA